MYSLNSIRNSLLRALGRIERKLKQESYLFDASSIFEAISRNRIELLVKNYTIELAKYELINILWKRLFLERDVSKEECDHIIEIIKNTLKLMHLLNINCNEKETFDLASKLEITIYYASYVYYAKKLNLKLVTEDQKLKRKIENYIKVCSIEEILE